MEDIILTKFHKRIERRTFLTVGFFSTALLITPSIVLSGELRTFNVTIVDGDVAKSHKTLRVTEGDRVAIQFTSDSAVTLHLHGIDVEIGLVAGKTGTMSFDANIAGRFPIEAHGTSSHGGLVYVEVHPK